MKSFNARSNGIMALTKIVATVGPATEKKETLCSLIKSGTNVFRFNLKHNTNRWHNDLIPKIKEAVKLTGQPYSYSFGFPLEDPKNGRKFKGIIFGKKT